MCYDWTKIKMRPARNTGKFTWAQVTSSEITMTFSVLLPPSKGKPLSISHEVGLEMSMEESHGRSHQGFYCQVLSRTQTNLQLMLLSWLPPCVPPSPPPLQSYRFSWKALKWGLECRGREDSSSALGLCQILIRSWTCEPMLISMADLPKSALPETIAFVLPVAVSKWGFGWEQYQRDRHIIHPLWWNWWPLSLSGWKLWQAEITWIVESIFLVNRVTNEN